MSLAAVTRSCAVLRPRGSYRGINLNIISILLRHASETGPFPSRSTPATTFSVPFWARLQLRGENR
jgi:hypothetical protein